MTVAAQTSFTEKREQASARVARLRKERGRALTDGRAFDDAKIREAEAELSRLHDAESEVTRRGREAEAISYAQERKRLIVELHAHETKRLAAIDRAEKATREL